MYDSNRPGATGAPSGRRPAVFASLLLASLGAAAWLAACSGNDNPAPDIVSVASDDDDNDDNDAASDDDDAATDDDAGDNDTSDDSDEPVRFVGIDADCGVVDDERVDCEEGFECVRIDPAKPKTVGQCRPVCIVSSPKCDQGEACATMGTGGGVCIRLNVLIVHEGSPCGNPDEDEFAEYDEVLCDENDTPAIACVRPNTASEEGVCAKQCVSLRGDLDCKEGEKCTAVKIGSKPDEYCLPEGFGKAKRYEACVCDYDCAEGLICVAPADGGVPRCLGECDADNPVSCMADEECFKFEAEEPASGMEQCFKPDTKGGCLPRTATP